MIAPAQDLSLTGPDGESFVVRGRRGPRRRDAGTIYRRLRSGMLAPIGALGTERFPDVESLAAWIAGERGVTFLDDGGQLAVVTRGIE